MKLKSQEIEKTMYKDATKKITSDELIKDWQKDDLDNSIEDLIKQSK